MFFKKLRSRTKSSSKSTKPSITRVTSGSFSIHAGTACSKLPELIVTPPEIATFDAQSKDEARDYQEFMAKAKREEEKAEKQRLREVQKAREVNLSPWASRM